MRICEGCGQEYEAFIGSVDGADKPSVGLCSNCRRKEEEQEYYDELLKVLPERIEHEREIWEGSCGIPPIFYGKTFKNFDRKLQPIAFDMAKSYRCEWDDNLENPPESMILLSPNLYGVGKTHLVCAIINREIAIRAPVTLSRQRGLVTHRCPAYFIAEASLLSRIRAIYNAKEGETESDVYRELTRDSLLVVDDVGKVRPKDYSFLQGVYYRIIDSRYVNQQPTILTTNLDYSEFEEHIGGACADRLREMCGKNIVKMTGESYRLKAHLRKKGGNDGKAES